MALRLREILKERNLTVAQFAEMSGMSQSNISNYMNGNISPTLETLYKISNALDIEITELFRKKEEIKLLAKYANETIEISTKELLDFVKSKLSKKNESNKGNQPT